MYTNAYMLMILIHQYIHAHTSILTYACRCGGADPYDRLEWLRDMNPELSRRCSEREFFIDNLLVRIPFNHRYELSRPALRHGSLNFHLEVALHLPSKAVVNTFPLSQDSCPACLEHV